MAMDKTTKLRRLEVVFDDSGNVGAQITVEEGYTVGTDYTKTGERTVGLDAGQQAQYTTKLAAILTAAGAQTLARVNRLQADNDAKDGELEDVKANFAGARAQIKALDTEIQARAQTIADLQQEVSTLQEELNSALRAAATPQSQLPPMPTPTPTPTPAST